MSEPQDDTTRARTTPGRVVVLGVGNILLTDEGVGPAIIAYLTEKWRFPADVELVDGGTAGFDLVSVFSRAEHLIVVDAVLGGEEPGALYRFHPDDVPAGVTFRTSLHQMGLLDAWSLARILGPVAEATIIGVEPEDIRTPHVGLTATIAGRLPRIEELVLAELARLGIRPEPRT